MLNENGTWWKTVKFFTKSFGCFAGYNRIVCTIDAGKTWQKTEVKESNYSYDFIAFSTIHNKPVALEECGKDFVSNNFGKTWIKK